MKQHAAWLAAAALAAAAPHYAPAADPPPKPEKLNLYIWEEYIDPEALDGFEEETGIEIVEDNFSSNEDMMAKIETGGGGYDIVCPSDYTVQRMTQRKLLAALDHANIPNIANVAPKFKNLAFDPGMKHSVPYQWGTTGIGFLKGKVSQPPKSWKEFFSEKFRADHKGRISMMDDSRECLGAALLALGYSINSKDAAEVAKARDLLKAMKPFLAKYDSDSFEDSLASGETLVAQGWSGDFATAATENEDIGFVIPAEGCILFIDNWAVPHDSPNKYWAEKFIDYILRPEVGGKIVNFMYYPSCSDAAKKHVDQDILKGISYMEPPAGKAFVIEELGPLNEVYEKAWLEVKGE